jgi:hypothetical protein
MIDLRKKQEAYQVNGLGTINYIVPVSFEGDECVYYEVFRSRKTAEHWLERGFLHGHCSIFTLRQAAKAYPKYFKY